MKHIQNILSLLCIAAALFTASCQSEEIDSQYEKSSYTSTFEVDGDLEYTVTAKSPKSITFNVSSYAAWTIVSDQSWCSASPESSSESALISSITIECEDSDEMEARSAKLTLSNTDSSSTPIVITVTQSAKSILSVTEFEGDFSADGQSRTITVSSNQGWSIKADSWLTFDVAGGDGDVDGTVVTATAEANAGLSRQTSVVIDNGDEEVTLVAIQNGATLEFVTTDGQSPTLTLSYEEDSATFDVNASMEWSVECDNPLFEVTKLSATQIEVSAPINVFVERSASVTLVATDGPSAGFVSEVPLVVTQGSGISPYGVYEIGSDGSLTLDKSSAAVNAYYITKSALKYGTLTWTFSAVSLSDAFFDITSRTTNTDENANFQIGFGESFIGTFGNRIRSGGTVSGVTMWADNTSFDLSNDELNAMHTLKYSVTPSPNKSNYLLIEAELNGVVLVSDELRPDLWAQVGALGFQQEVGLIGTIAVGSVTITSCTFTSYSN
ncbi:MAG: BACON domain-containing carbohydrate-binding protein [Rikenellaceae bacterium]